MNGFRSVALAAMGVLVATATAQIDPTKTVLVVNGEEIKAGEYFRRMEFLADVGRLNNGNLDVGAPGMLTLQRLIEERLLLIVAKEKGQTPTQAEVQALIAEKSELEPEFVKNWTSGGLTQSDLEYQITLEVARFKLTTMGITITDSEVEKHYKDNPTRFTVPKRYKLRVLAVKQDKKAAVDAALAGGKAFSEVAKEMSEDPSKVTGGELGLVPEDNFTGTVKQILQATKIGKASDWIQGETMSVKFFVEDIMPEKLVPLDPKLKTQLRKSLMIDRGVVKNNVEAMLREARKKVNLELKLPYFQAPFQRLVDSYKLGG